MAWAIAKPVRKCFQFVEAESKRAPKREGWEESFLGLFDTRDADHIARFTICAESSRRALKKALMWHVVFETNSWKIVWWVHNL